MSTIFDSIGIDPGIIIIALLAIVVILIGVMISNGMRLTRLERKYKMFMKGSDAQSLEKTFVRKFAQIDRLYEAKEDHEHAIKTLEQHFKVIFSKYGVENTMHLMMWVANSVLRWRCWIKIIQVLF